MEVAVGCTGFDSFVEEDIGCTVCSVHWVSSQAEKNMRKISAIVVEVVDAVAEVRMIDLVVMHFQNNSFLHQCLHLQARKEEELKRNSGTVVNMEQKPYPCLRRAERGYRTDMSCSCVLRAFGRSSELPWII